MQQTQYDAIVIGAGHNGLVTSAYLAKEGLKVLVLERLDRVGGAVVSEELTPGFTVPYCSYVLHILQGRVIDDLELREHGLDIIPFVSFRLDPFPDGRYILTHREHHKNAEELRKFSEHDARAYPDWANFWERASGLLTGTGSGSRPPWPRSPRTSGAPATRRSGRPCSR